MDKFLQDELEGFCAKNAESLNIPTDDVKLDCSITDTISQSLKKTESIMLLVIPQNIYESMTHDKHMLDIYVEQQLRPWHENTEVEPYVVLTKEEAIEEYEDNKDDYPNQSEYYMKFHGGYLNEVGDVVSTINENGLYSSYYIKHSGVTLGEVMDMILSGEISFQYIVHNGHLCDKGNDDTVSGLTECDQNSYFMVISCVD